METVSFLPQANKNGCCIEGLHGRGKPRRGREDAVGVREMSGSLGRRGYVKMPDICRAFLGQRPPPFSCTHPQKAPFWAENHACPWVVLGAVVFRLILLLLWTALLRCNCQTINGTYLKSTIHVVTYTPVKASQPAWRTHHRPRFSQAPSWSRPPPPCPQSFLNDYVFIPFPTFLFLIIKYIDVIIPGCLSSGSGRSWYFFHSPLLKKQPHLLIFLIVDTNASISTLTLISSLWNRK